MKHTQNRRHHDFLQTCRCIMSSSRYSLRPIDLARRALARQAPGYYIDEDHAYRMVLAYKKYGKLPIRASTRRMCLELCSRVDEMLASAPVLSIGRALKRVLESGRASRYFMSDKTALNLIQRHYRLLLNHSI